MVQVAFIRAPLLSQKIQVRRCQLTADNGLLTPSQLSIFAQLGALANPKQLGYC